jgi:NAD(P)-dependent dehydrogenase (short-subunit alcohol dehydrogenase family)
VKANRYIALDNVKHSIRVNCVCPSWVDTPLVQRACEQAPGLDQAIVQQIPMGRLGLPEEIADAIIFLCSPKASWVNGSSFMVDGAMTAAPFR